MPRVAPYPRAYFGPKIFNRENLGLDQTLVNDFALLAGESAMSLCYADKEVGCVTRERTAVRGQAVRWSRSIFQNRGQRELAFGIRRT